MDKFSFTFEHDRLQMGPFPVDKLNELFYLDVKIERIDAFKDLLTFTMIDDEYKYNAIFIIGMYTQLLLAAQLKANSN